MPEIEPVRFQSLENCEVERNRCNIRHFQFWLAVFSFGGMLLLATIAWGSTQIAVDSRQSALLETVRVDVQDTSLRLEKIDTLVHCTREEMAALKAGQQEILRAVKVNR